MACKKTLVQAMSRKMRVKTKMLLRIRRKRQNRPKKKPRNLPEMMRLKQKMTIPTLTEKFLIMRTHQEPFLKE